MHVNMAWFRAEIKIDLLAFPGESWRTIINGAFPESNLLTR